MENLHARTYSDQNQTQEVLNDSVLSFARPFEAETSYEVLTDHTNLIQRSPTNLALPSHQEASRVYNRLKERYWYLKTLNEAQMLSETDQQTSNVLGEILKQTLIDIKSIMVQFDGQKVSKNASSILKCSTQKSKPKNLKVVIKKNSEHLEDYSQSVKNKVKKNLKKISQKRIREAEKNKTDRLHSSLAHQNSVDSELQKSNKQPLTGFSSFLSQSYSQELDQSLKKSAKLKADAQAIESYKDSKTHSKTFVVNRDSSTESGRSSSPWVRFSKKSMHKSEIDMFTPVSLNSTGNYKDIVKLKPKSYKPTGNFTGPIELNTQYKSIREKLKKTVRKPHTGMVVCIADNSL
ncbi:unnamed protein product [Moneuplotes crassus]|uniref:Uncharacterized protein n=1 Tax=Euplotes crassus TaxID=5936 RepID=A0AAD1UCM0_EUPCR|nr:unnamed protein product [Moneuplotes crassus]